MNKVTKILVTAIAVIIFIVLFGALIGIRESFICSSIVSNLL